MQRHRAATPHGEHGRVRTGSAPSAAARPLWEASPPSSAATTTPPSCSCCRRASAPPSACSCGAACPVSMSSDTPGLGSSCRTRLHPSDRLAEHSDKFSLVSCLDPVYSKTFRPGVNITLHARSAVGVVTLMSHIGSIPDGNAEMGTLTRSPRVRRRSEKSCAPRAATGCSLQRHTQRRCSEHKWDEKNRDTASACVETKPGCLAMQQPKPASRRMPQDKVLLYARSQEIASHCNRYGWSLMPLAWPGMGDRPSEVVGLESCLEILVTLSGHDRQAGHSLRSGSSPGDEGSSGAGRDMRGLPSSSFFLWDAAPLCPPSTSRQVHLAWLWLRGCQEHNSSKTPEIRSLILIRSV